MWHRWLKMSLAVSVVIALYGFGQLFGWLDIHQGATRIDATLGNSEYMAVYMLIHAFIAAYFFFVVRKLGGPAFFKWAYPGIHYHNI